MSKRVWVRKQHEHRFDYAAAGIRAFVPRLSVGLIIPFAYCEQCRRVPNLRVHTEDVQQTVEA